MRYLVVFFVVAAVSGCATAPEAPLTDDGTPPKFVVYKGNDKKCRWQLVSSNGNVIAMSSESYSSLESCDRSIEITKRSAQAEIEDKR